MKGKAQVAITFDNWPAGQVASSQHEIELIAAKPGVAPQLVSSRLKQSLIHPSRKNGLQNIQFSPDGTRIIAGDFGGSIQVWNVQDGKQIARIDTHASRVDGEYYFVSTDWSTIYTCRAERDARRIQKDGKRMLQWNTSGDVRVWDLNSGELLNSLTHDVPRGIQMLKASPDRSTFVTLEELSGESPNLPPRSATLWETDTRRQRAILGAIEYWAVYSPDSSILAAPVETPSGRGTAIKLFDTVTGAQKAFIPFEEGASAGFIEFTPDSRLLVGELRWNGGEKHCLKLWDTLTGDEVAEFKGEPHPIFGNMAVSPDSRLLAISTFGAAKLLLFDLVTRQDPRVIEFDDANAVGPPTFSHSGTLLAVGTQQVEQRPNLDAEDLPQPRIHLIDVATGAVRETLIAPHGFIPLARFSPDDQTLATTTLGKVLLWDLTAPFADSLQRAN